MVAFYYINMLRIVGACSAEQFDIIEVKIPFDLNIICYLYIFIVFINVD